MSLPTISMRPRRLRRLMYLIALGAIVACAALTLVIPKAHAEGDPVVGCQTDGWGFLFSQRRELCDGPIHPDGSWLRRRIVYTPAHQVPLRTYCSGGAYYSSCSTSGGYFQPYTESDNETYPVTEDTVLPDEPGHLVGGI